jgi:O-antigen/teichoic acid export membrane protein
MFPIVQLADIKQFATTKFMRNTGWLLVEQLFRMALSLVVLSLMARHLGVEQFGLLNYSLAFIMVGVTITNLGIDNILVNEFIKNRADTGALLGTTLILRFIAALVAIINLLIIVYVLNPHDTLLFALASIHAGSLIFVIFDSIDCWFQSNLQSKYAVIAKSIAFFIVSCWRLVFIFLDGSVHYFALATVLEALLIGIFLMIYYRRFQGPTLKFSMEFAKQLLQRSAYFFIAGLLIMIYTQMDKILLGHLSTHKTVGIYMAALTISSMWMFIANALIESARPLIMTAKLEDEQQYAQKNKQLFCAIIWIGIGASIVITLLSKPLILLIYGPEFIEAVHVLTILIWSRIFSLMGSVRSIWLTMEGLGQYQVTFVGIAAVTNVLLNIVLIPKYGATGAAIATLLAEMGSAFFAVLLFQKTKPLFRLIIEAILCKGIR